MLCFLTGVTAFTFLINNSPPSIHPYFTTKTHHAHAHDAHACQYGSKITVFLLAMLPPSSAIRQPVALAILVVHAPRHCFVPQNRDCNEIDSCGFVRSQRQRARSGDALAAATHSQLRCAPTVTHSMHGTQHACTRPWIVHASIHSGPVPPTRALYRQMAMLTYACTSDACWMR